MIKAEARLVIKLIEINSLCIKKSADLLVLFPSHPKKSVVANLIWKQCALKRLKVFPPRINAGQWIFRHISMSSTSILECEVFCCCSKSRGKEKVSPWETTDKMCVGLDSNTDTDNVSFAGNIAHHTTYGWKVLGHTFNFWIWVFSVSLPQMHTAQRHLWNKGSRWRDHHFLDVMYVPWSRFT